ncbi:hypothetical protein [Paraburkholderia graminis]|uniref:Transmembrane protein n=1 Tax=Paraburkholderia graminis TaxID=60548 RepID=A0ABD5CB85_9BURK|nr:hypothetical protein [Paraburkholderia graminis]MDR6202526.1 hypothetical protein [Paraburkholderia graminis]
MNAIQQRIHNQGAPPAGCALWLAFASTATALCISVLAGWQRGGWLSERIAWVAIGAVLVVTVHVLPALCRTAPVAVRVVGAGLWGICMVTTCYGHATFFLLAQEHAGASRVAALPSTVVPVLPVNSLSGPLTVRSLATIAAEHADVTVALARADVRRCVGDCPALRVTRVSLAAKLDALDAEADEAKRRQAAEDREQEETERVTAARDALRDSRRDDPVTSRLAASLGVTAARVDLVSGLVFAGVLESVACLFWFLALGPSEIARDPARDPIQGPVTDASRDAASVTPEVASGESPAVSALTRASSPVAASHASVVPQHSTVVPAFMPAGVATACQPPTDLARLVQAIEAGQVRATVAAIRRYLGCSQAKATALRRQLGFRSTELTAPADQSMRAEAVTAERP